MSDTTSSSSMADLGAPMTVSDLVKDPELIVRKVGMLLEIAAFAGPPPTPEQIESYKAAQAERAAAWARIETILAQVTDPVARAVLDLHAEDDRGDCSGCEFDGFEAEPPSYPCTTVLTIVTALGHQLPDAWT